MISAPGWTWISLGLAGGAFAALAAVVATDSAPAAITCSIGLLAALALSWSIFRVVLGREFESQRIQRQRDSAVLHTRGFRSWHYALMYLLALAAAGATAVCVVFDGPAVVIGGVVAIAAACGCEQVRTVAFRPSMEEAVTR